MCHSTEYDHLIPDADEDFGLMTPEEIAEHMAWRETLRAEFAPTLPGSDVPWPQDPTVELNMRAERTRLRALAGLPLEADALAFARSLR